MKNLQQTFVHGKIISKFFIDQESIDDLNKKYENHKNKLDNFGKRLAGRIDDEKNITSIFENTKAFRPIINCMNDYVEELKKFEILDEGTYNLDILSCWVNDMKSGEYNPPHTHHDNIGFSTVLFLKVPEFINDATEPHKFKDGQLRFISVDGVNGTWVEPKVGDFYIFQADHQHSVMPFKTKEPGKIRRSMSFNFLATPHEKSKDFIRHYDNIMSPEICNAILDECKSLSFEALTRETPDGNYLTKERKCHGAPLPKQFENDMFESVGKILVKYSQDIKEFNMNNIQDTGYEILHYKSNEKGEFKSHVDHFDLYPRTLSISLLLNDDFDGGDFLFFDDQYKAPKKQGGAIVFPSNFCYPHRVSPVIKNDRYSIITWIH